MKSISKKKYRYEINTNALPFFLKSLQPSTFENFFMLLVL